MNKFIKIAAAVSVVSAVFCTGAFCSDYKGHWAESVIDNLINEDIVKGEGENVNPESNINRAEFIALINRAFSYSIEAGENFLDVPEDKWYAKDFRIAKKYGLVMGDEEGRANPECEITRNEAAVIIARTLNANENNELSFKDDIPAWALSSVKALAGMKIISGYEDNTFRGGLPLKRCEAFVIIYKSKSFKKENKEVIPPVSNTSGVVVSTPKRTSSGGGSGGGGSSSNSSNKLFPPILKTMNDDYTLSWEEVKNAKEYEVAVTFKEERKSFKTADTTVNLKEIAKELTAEALTERANLKVSVRAIGKSSGSNSEYSKDISFEYIIMEPEKSVDLGVTVSCTEVMGDEKYFLNVPEDIESVTIKKAGGKAVYNDFVNPVDITDFISENGIINETDYIIVAKKGDKEQYILTNFCYGGGDGTVENPFIISSTRHFNNIEKNMDKSFVQINDIENVKSLYNSKKEFTGTYKAETGTTVSLENTDGLDYHSLFGITNGAKIENVNLTGKLSANGKYIGGIVGYAKATEIINCNNNADIVLSGDNMADGSICGGIAGYIDSESIISDCVNNAKAETSSSIIGGICGISDGLILNCENYGEIKALAKDFKGNDSCVGGIAALATGEGKIENCKNNGFVSCNYTEEHNSNNQYCILAGGIAGYAYKVYDSENSDTATVTSVILSGTPSNLGGTGFVGGIMGRVEKTAEITGCKNYGTVKSDASQTTFWCGGISGIQFGSVLRCANYSDTLSGRQVGGISGRLNGRVSETINDGLINCLGYSGGFSARIDALGVIEYSVNLGDINGKYAGAFSGSCGSADAKIINSFSVPKTAASNAIIQYNQDINIVNVYYVKRNSETAGANKDAIQISESELNTKEIVDILNTGSDGSTPLLEDVFKVGENGILLPELINNLYE